MSIVLTGATTGIGRATARLLAGSAGHLILHGLEPTIGDFAPGDRITYFPADFGDLDEVERLAARIRAATDRIDVLINNAARPGPPARTVNAAGHEVTFQANYLAPVLLTTRLLDLTRRVVNVASATHLSATFAGPGRPYSAAGVYAYSKLALVAYSCWLSRRRAEVVSMHPGVIATPLLHAMFPIGGDRPEHAAGNVRYVASRRGDNGTYYDERTPAPPNPEALDPAAQERLIDLTVRALDVSALSEKR
ncbi:SDR family NAD(P)-dependent oxidoreductase [Actinoplanes sp. NPDC048796]|uniref:SDR family NAD(P)-dependent oxidoreductase n=1 Tax=unclassified Actinoplanes TaxID=2626549 RepID=UPI0033EA488B